MRDMDKINFILRKMSLGLLGEADKKNEPTIEFAGEALNDVVTALEAGDDKEVQRIASVLRKKYKQSNGQIIVLFQSVVPKINLSDLKDLMGLKGEAE